MAKTLAPTAARSMPIDLDGQFDEFLDALRREQMTFLDSMRTICLPLGSASGALATAATGQARLTQQFLDAQRSLLRRTAEFESAATGIQRSAVEDARQVVTGAANYALDCGVPGDALESLRWSELDDAADRNDQAEYAADVVRRQQQELSALLDRWWAETQDRGSSLVERANTYAGHVRSRADERVAQILEAVARHAAPHSTEAPLDSASLLPADMLSALDCADQTDLGGLIDSLLQSLVPAGAAESVEVDASADGASAAPMSTDSLIDSLFAAVAHGDVGASSVDGLVDTDEVPAVTAVDDTALIRLGERATERNLLGSVVAPAEAVAQPSYYEAEGPYGMLAVFTRVLLPMGISIAAAVLFLAWLG